MCIDHEKIKWRPEKVNLFQKLVSELKKDPVKTIKRVAARPYLILQRLYKQHIIKDPFTVEAARWFRDRGDETLRLDYDLSVDSVVFDLGGYVGDFADEIHKKYGCEVYLFEPSKKFFDLCVNRFENNNKIHCFNFGLSDVDGEFFLSDGDDGSSIKDERSDVDESGELVLVKSFEGFYNEFGAKKIDLLKINIEGGEFDVLPHVIDKGIVNNISNLQIQFHNFIDGAEEKRDEIRRGLDITHENNWCYKFLWENWVLK